MTPLVAVMVLSSACLHPVWNMLLKGDDDRAASWWLFTVMLASIGFVVCLVRGADFMSITEVLPWVSLSMLGQLFYGTTLVKIYDKGDLSAYYPIVRASPIGVVILGFLFLDKTYGILVLAGIALTVFGAFWLQKQPGRRLLDDPKTLMLAVLSMMGTAFYSIGDSRAVSVVAPEVEFFWVEFSMVPVFVLTMWLNGHRRIVPRAFNLIRTRPARHLFVGVLAYTSYALILLAYANGGDVAAVTIMRQLSIPLSVLLGGMVLKETLIVRRFGASLLLVGGIVMVIFGS